MEENMGDEDCEEEENMGVEASEGADSAPE